MAETKNNFFQDLLKAQQEIEKVDKDGKNPFFKSDYASLNATIEACKKALNDNNIMVLQPIQSDENGVFVCTTLIHTSGDKLDSKMAIREAKSHDPQAQGSAITYARRYSLKAMLCMSDEDDDGNKAQKSYQSPSSNLSTEKQRLKITSLMRDTKTSIDQVREHLKMSEGDKMTTSQASEAIKYLSSRGEVQ